GSQCGLRILSPCALLSRTWRINTRRCRFRARETPDTQSIDLPKSVDTLADGSRLRNRFVWWSYGCLSTPPTCISSQPRLSGTHFAPSSPQHMTRASMPKSCSADRQSWNQNDGPAARAFGGIPASKVRTKGLSNVRRLFLELR